VDVRPSVTDVAAANEEAAGLLAAKLGWLGASPESVLIFGVKISALGSARPVEVVEAFTDPAVAREAPIARLGLWAAPAKSAAQEEGGVFVDPLLFAMGQLRGGT
jgi:hypothetical protein